MKFKSLEAFRGIAAVMIVLYHSPFYTEASHVAIVRNSPLFVDFFFVLSGFVMSFAYLEKIGNSVSFKQFFLLRFGRLYPLHLFMLLLWVPYVLVKVYLRSHGFDGKDPTEHNNILSFITNILLMQSLGIHKELTWNYPSWSISLEFYTYIVFFTFALYFYKGKRRFLLSVLVALISYILLHACGRGILRTFDFGILRCIGGFFAGIAVSTIYKKFPVSINSVIYATFVELVVLYLLIYVVSIAQGGDSEIFVFLSILLFMGVVYLFSIQDVGFFSRILQRKIPLFLGRLSYSIYMTHALIFSVALNVFQHIIKVPVVSFEGASAAMVFHGANYLNTILVLIVIFLSTLTYTFIEMPWRERFRNIANNIS